ncbi:hypothetical protein VP01_3121g1, partial [Puccinia sorghi]
MSVQAMSVPQWSTRLGPRGSEGSFEAKFYSSSGPEYDEEAAVWPDIARSTREAHAPCHEAFGDQHQRASSELVRSNIGKSVGPAFGGSPSEDSIRTSSHRQAGAEAKAAGATKNAATASLSTNRSFQSGAGSIDKKDCTICLSDIEASESTGVHVLSACRHQYHKSCIKDWLRQHTTCPNCRVPVVADREMLGLPAIALASFHSPDIPVTRPSATYRTLAWFVEAGLISLVVWLANPTSPSPAGQWPPPRPPDPPNQSKHASREDLVDGMDLEDAPQTRLPEKPTTNPPSLVFLTFLAGIIGNPNNCLADGT